MSDNATTPYIVALIPARAGSKGVPGKNIMVLNGKPLISYTISQALQSTSITRTIVSTDGADIAAVATEHGAEVPFMRPAEFARDASPDIDVFRHLLDYLRDTEGRLPDLVVHLRPTGPIRRVALIDKAIGLMLDHPEATALRSIALAEQTPYKMWLMDGAFLKPVATVPGLPDAHSVGRQQLPRAYWQNGYVDIVRPQTILEGNSMVGDRPLAFLVDQPKYDIDYPKDVPIVEHALRVFEQTGRLPEEDEAEDSAQRFPV